MLTLKSGNEKDCDIKDKKEVSVTRLWRPWCEGGSGTAVFIVVQKLTKFF